MNPLAKQPPDSPAGEDAQADPGNSNLDTSDRNNPFQRRAGKSQENSPGSSEERSQSRGWQDWLPAMPSAHFMALAPLDVWIRVLFFPMVRIPLRFYPRLFALLVSSTFATIITLPERLVMALWFRLRPLDPAKLPGPVFVLGYYRSGTTHLQYLLNCDPQMMTPRWYHTLAPQGFVLTWGFFRALMIPFMSGSRPMDGVGIGPEYPAEDHFGVHNWSGACPLMGKAVLPEQYSYYNRYNTLQDLTPQQRKRWRYFQWALICKLALVAGKRRLLLKSPSHTAHVDELLEMFADVPGVKFIHITRHPHKVVQSNVWLHEVFQTIWNLQDRRSQETLEDWVVADYVETEQRYLAVRQRIPPGQLAEVRIQDLHADPLGELQRIYQQLGLEITPQFRQRVLDYLHANRAYRPNKHRQWTQQQHARLSGAVEPLIEQFGHHQPPIEKVPLPEVAEPTAASRSRQEWIARGGMLLVGGLCATVWSLLSSLVPGYGPELNRLIFPTAFAVGSAALALAPHGSISLGLWSLAVTSLTLLGANAAQIGLGFSPDPSAPIAQQFSTHLINLPTIFWSAFAFPMVYLIASRPRVI